MIQDQEPGPGAPASSCCGAPNLPRPWQCVHAYEAWRLAQGGPKRCSCHSDLSLYGDLVRCPRCRHWSLDRQGDWEACERRRCGYELVGRRATQEAPGRPQLELGL